MPLGPQQFGTVTYREIIQTARDAMPAFNDKDRHPDRMLLSQLDNVQAWFFRQVADQLKDRISLSRTLATKVAGVLVGVDPNGVPYAVVDQSGYPFLVGTDTVPYLGADALILDPAQGGFILPDDSIQIIDVYATLTLSFRQPVRWLEQRELPKVTSTFNELYAVVIGWKLVPVKNPSDHKSLWDDVQDLTISYIPQAPKLDPTDPTVLDQLTVIPVVYHHLLHEELAAYLALREKSLDKDFPDGIVSKLTRDADAARAGIIEIAAKDHRFIKTRRTMRNR